jgi:hypothetical protein
MRGEWWLAGGLERLTRIMFLHEGAFEFRVLDAVLQKHWIERRETSLKSNFRWMSFDFRAIMEDYRAQNYLVSFTPLYLMRLEGFELMKLLTHQTTSLSYRVEPIKTGKIFQHLNKTRFNLSQLQKVPQTFPSQSSSFLLHLFNPDPTLDLSNPPDYSSPLSGKNSIKIYTRANVYECNDVYLSFPVAYGEKRFSLSNSF